MMIAESLYQLQQIDDAIRASERRLAKVLALLGESEELRAARSGLTQAETALHELEKRQRVRELDLQATAEKLRTEESRLYGGRVRNPKELAGLQKEVRYLKQRHAELEDDLLDTMVAREDARERVTEQTTALSGIEAAWQREQAGLLSEREELEAAIAESSGRRAQLLDRIPAHALSRYDYLIRTKGVAVALVENGMCIGCRVSLSAVDRQRVQSGELMTCDNCSRILFAP